jgi:hypothetical protein
LEKPGNCRAFFVCNFDGLEKFRRFFPKGAVQKSHDSTRLDDEHREEETIGVTPVQDFKECGNRYGSERRGQQPKDFIFHG